MFSICFLKCLKYLEQQQQQQNLFSLSVHSLIEWLAAKQEQHHILHAAQSFGLANASDSWNKANGDLAK